MPRKDPSGRGIGAGRESAGFSLIPEPQTTPLKPQEDKKLLPTTLLGKFRLNPQKQRLAKDIFAEFHFRSKKDKFLECGFFSAQVLEIPDRDLTLGV